MSDLATKEEFPFDHIYMGWGKLENFKSLKSDVCYRLSQAPFSGAAVNFDELLGGEIRDLWLKLSARCLLAEFHGFRSEFGYELDPTSSVAREKFSEDLTVKGGFDRLCEAYPVLDRRLDAAISNRLNAWNQFVDDVIEDWSSVQAKLLGGASGRVVSINGGEGDSHQKGRSVVRCDLSDGRSVFYKPHSLSADLMMAELFGVLDQSLEHSIAKCVPTTIDKGSHGWQIGRPVASMNDPGEHERFFYRFGALCAFVSSVGARDLHHENLIPNGEFPVIVDNETILGHPYPWDVDSVLGTLTTRKYFSPAGAMLLPLHTESAKIDLSLSAFERNNEQQSEIKNPFLVDIGSDAIRFEWRPITIAPPQSLPSGLDGALNPIAFRKQIEQGYVHAMKGIRSEKFTKILQGWPSFPTRFVPRPTMAYARLMDASTHPEYLVSDEAMEDFFELLNPFDNSHMEGLGDKVIDFERQCMFEDDVPYFSGPSHGTSMQFGDSTAESVLSTSLAEQAAAAASFAASVSDEAHISTVRLCLAELGTYGDEHEESNESNFEILNELVGGDSYWCDIADRFVGTAVATSDDQKVGWVIGSHDKDITLSGGDQLGFHDAGGIIAFLLRCAEIDDNYAEIAAKAESGLLELIGKLKNWKKNIDSAPAELKTRQHSITWGIPSYFLSSTHFDDQWVDLLLNRPVELGSKNSDVIKGPAGTLLVLSSELETMGLLSDPRVQTILDAVVSTVELPDSSLKERAWFDVAHGDLGMYWAISRGAAALKHDELVERSAEWFLTQLDESPLPETGVWCKGLAGLVLAGAEIAIHADNNEVRERVLALDLSVCKNFHKQNTSVEMSVCHGTSGIVQSLIAASRLLESAELFETGLDIHDAAHAHAKKIGVDTGLAGLNCLDGYFLGWAGIGDTDLLVSRIRDDKPVARMPIELVPIRHTMINAET